MEKVIKIVMCNDRNIEIYVNDEEKHIIESQARNINADVLYKIFDFKLGDSYTVTSENESGTDNQVLVFFEELLREMVLKINDLNEMNDVSEDIGENG